MDTNLPSPTASSSTNAARLAAALSMGALICAAAASAGTATAQTANQTATEIVSIADLDLSTADGAFAFLKRVDVAAQRACGGELTHSPLLPREAGLFEQCVREAISMAVRTADAPMVASAHTDALILASR